MSQPPKSGQIDSYYDYKKAMYLFEEESQPPKSGQIDSYWLLPASLRTERQCLNPLSRVK